MSKSLIELSTEVVVAYVQTIGPSNYISHEELTELIKTVYTTYNDLYNN